MKKLLEKKLKFKYIPQKGVYAWYKIYTGFVLYVVKTAKEDFYLACIKVQNIEIVIPGFVDEKWINEFDKEHK